jgi:drug/metabolite transporter (DMT)-like permease
MTVAASSLPVPSRNPVARPDGTLLLILLGGACTGFSGILVRLSDIGPIATGAWRMGLATLILLPFAATSAKAAMNWRPAPILLVAGFCFAIDMCFYHWSLTLTSIAHSTLIVNLAPLVALSAGFLLFGEKLGTLKLFGLVASLSGAFLMTAMRSGSPGTLEGNGLAAIGMIGYALYLIVVKQARSSGHDTMSIMVWSSGMASAIMFAIALAAGESILPRTVENWTVVLLLGLVAHVFGQGLVAYGMRTAPVGLASILLLIQPVVAAIAAWFIFNETFTPVEMAGALMVLAGLAVASRSTRA